MTRLWHFVIIVLGLGFFSLVSAEAQQLTREARVGWLGLDLKGSPQFLEAFRQGLPALGYTEGRNLVIEYRDAEGKFERLAALASELAALKVDIIVAGATPQALAAQKATKTIPIVFLASDPVASGLVTNLARPDGNLTGVSTLGPDLVGKSLEVLKEAVPGVRSIAVLSHQDAGGLTNMLTGATVAGRALGVQLQFAEVSGPAGFERAFSEMARARVGGLIVLPGAQLAVHGRRLAALAAKHRLPALYVSMKECVAAGGLMSYGADSRALYLRLATYVDRILKGARASDLPVEQPTKFELVINAKASRNLGLTIPSSVLVRADEVIEK